VCQLGGNVSGTVCPDVLCYAIPVALHVGACQSTACFSLDATLLPAPKGLVILQLVTKSLHRPSFQRTVKCVCSGTVNSLHPSMLSPEPEVYANC